jgi:hypothetical protein
MRKLYIIALTVGLAVPALAGSPKESGSTKLKDVQPAGVTDKNHKKQQYDFTFDSAKNEYTCRSNEKEKVNATDFVVGSDIQYQVQGNKGKVKSTSTGKQLGCMIVRVAQLPVVPQ